MRSPMERTSTYLNFSRHTEEAFLFYKSVFGGEFVGGIQRMRDMPVAPGQPPLADNDRDLIVHIELTITGGHLLMGTDAPESMGFNLVRGNQMHINLEPVSRQEADRLFHSLSAGGKVTMPLQEMFWGAYFGSCVDQFGVQWMVNFDEKRSQRDKIDFDPEFDLSFTINSSLTLEQIWKGWTDPETLMKWFCPRPWKVTDCRIELWAGGEFHTVMEGPNGERHAGSGCFLEVIPYRKIVWTNMQQKGFRPNKLSENDFGFVATIEIEKSEGGTLYTATVRHESAAGKTQHEKMGFEEGWSLAFKQLVELYQ